MIKTTATIFCVLSALLTISSITMANGEETCSLTIKVDGLRNSKGVIQFALYNKEGSIPDREFKKYFKKRVGKIANTTSSVTFDNLPKGRYAINILHDENVNGEIDRGFIKPIEGVGFSNYQTIGLTNRPNYSNASFELQSNITKTVKIIYF